ncbi:unnamed protein product [Rotaria sp. Silwood2]|nr:unnamed protein product [Rotaria sp. Silwood2]CAF2537494.1 unnamed protein product [Rotaria sp. Silwood2]CAF2789562.1 unnamed protein product [Rotaria sp. Silwood2]CAF2934650.1 unnamed protein product [Rotaria sp. Silwood2]CAF4495617.1 unnamed protein product [Rotaria sp. Silwood2]
MGRDRSRSMSSSSSGRGLQAAAWDGDSGYRIHVSDLAVGISRKEIERSFGKYGAINEVWVATNPPCFAFINYKHRSDAEKAIREVDGKMIGSTRVGVSWARTRRYGGRNGGGRSAPYGSYRSSRGGRRRSSRSRSDSRHRRRRNSRSRSRDHNRRRSASPRDRRRSSRKSNEKNGNDVERKSERKSKTPRSASRSRSRSTPPKESTNDKKKRSPSRSPSPDVDDTGSPSAVRTDDNNAYDGSPLATADE